MLSNLFSNADRATTSTTDLTTSLSPQVVPGKSALDLTVQLNRSTSEPLQQALQGAETALSQFAADRAFTAKMNVAFGDRWNPQVAKQLFQAWAAHDFRNLPKLEIRLGAEINHANGAFASATNTIYISRDFLAQNASNPKAVTSVLVEEIGHAIDFRINKFDAAGDEGDIFSRLVRGEKISASELLQLKAEDDHAVVKINGRATAIEMSQIAMVSLNGKIYQSTQGTDNQIYTRISTDGVNWTAWNNNGGGTTPSAPTLAVLNNKLYQSVRGTDNQIYTRISTDGVNWTAWNNNGGGTTPSAPTLAVFNNKLYQSVRGTDNQIYTRISTDGVNWTAWNNNGGGTTPSAPTLAVFNNKLYQSVRGTDNQIYTRISTDGVNWTAWNNNGGGTTPSAPTLAVLNNKLYQSVRGTDNQIYTRISTDGVNWTAWNNNGGGTTPDAPSLTVFNGKLYQSHQGMDNKIYTRSSTDGTNWTGWIEKGGLTPTEKSDLSVQPKLGSGSMSPDQFFSWANGQVGIGRLDTSAYKGQCVSLIARYLEEVFLPPSQKNQSMTLGDGGYVAGNVASKFSQYFESLTNQGLPKRGAVISFQQLGHVAIVMESRTFNGQRQVKIMDSNGDFKAQNSTVRTYSYWINVPDGSSAGYGKNIVWTNPK